MSAGHKSLTVISAANSGISRSRAGGSMTFLNSLYSCPEPAVVAVVASAVLALTSHGAAGPDHASTAPA